MSSSSARIWICALAASALLALIGVVPAQADAATLKPGQIRVSVRIEAPDRTLFNGVVTTSAKAFSTEAVPGTPCDGLSVRSFAPTGPSPLTALNDALTQATKGFWSDAAVFNYGSQTVGSQGLKPGVKAFSFGPELCRIGRYVANPATGTGWKLKVNNRSGAGAGGISPTAPIGNGASVLWYFGDASVTRSFDLKLPSRVIAGKLFKGSVSAFINATDQQVAAKNVSIGGNSSVKAGSNGVFKMRLRAPGTYVISSGAASTVRGSDVICVYKRGSGDCGTRRR